MINYLKFENLNGLELIDLTNNTIIVFNTREALKYFKAEFEMLMSNTDYEKVAYSTDNYESNIKIDKTVVCRDISGIYHINQEEQRIILTVEPISTLAIDNHDDLWFVDRYDDNSWISVNFTEYNNHEVYIRKEDVYKFICESKYGCVVV
jgi:hypothetical protein